jgi:hypothetical protein
MAHFMGVRGAVKLIKGVVDDLRGAPTPRMFSECGRRKPFDLLPGQCAQRLRSLFGPDHAQRHRRRLFIDVRAATPVAPLATSQPTDPIFRSLSQVDGQSQPVSSTVHELWDRRSSLTADAAPAMPTASASAPRP